MKSLQNQFTPTLFCICFLLFAAPTFSQTCTDGIQNGDETGIDVGGPCGCLEIFAHNYNPSATENNFLCETCFDGIQNGDETGIDIGGSCEGCTDYFSHNFSPIATTDDGSCETCLDGIQNGDESGIDSGGSCGCTEYYAYNYDPNALFDNGSCESCYDGILNGNETGIDTGGSCGCIFQDSHNYDPIAIYPNNSCENCYDGIQNGDETGIDIGGSCGCTYQDAHNYDSDAIFNNGTCETCYDGVQNGDETGIDVGGSCGCKFPDAHNYDPAASFNNYLCETCSDGIQNGPETGIDIGGPCGCTELSAHNYDPIASFDNNTCETCYDGMQNGDETGIDTGGSCQGCTNYYAHNYNPIANSDDGSCESCYDNIQNGDETGVDTGGSCEGCTDYFSHNYTPTAVIDNGSCETCLDGVQNGNETDIDIGGSCGCTEYYAYNYEPFAFFDNGSCETCYDGIQNGNETAIDVGPDCGCTDFYAHNYNSNAIYLDNSCETCYDGILNGDEEGVDCGGSNFACSPCGILGCTEYYAHNYDPNAQSNDGNCETCTDGIQNGDETGVDCGGTNTNCVPCCASISATPQIQLSDIYNYNGFYELFIEITNTDDFTPIFDETTEVILYTENGYYLNQSGWTSQLYIFLPSGNCPPTQIYIEVVCQSVYTSNTITLSCDNDNDNSLIYDDCDDTNTDVYPGAPEICDGLDNNCDGNIDENFATNTIICFADFDEDGVSGNNTFTFDVCIGLTCEDLGYFSSTGQDCNDFNPAVTTDCSCDILYDGIGFTYDEQCEGQEDGIAYVAAYSSHDLYYFLEGQNPSNTYVNLNDGYFVNLVADTYTLTLSSSDPVDPTCSYTYPNVFTINPGPNTDLNENSIPDCQECTLSFIDLSASNDDNYLIGPCFINGSATIFQSLIFDLSRYEISGTGPYNITINGKVFTNVDVHDETTWPTISYFDPDLTPAIDWSAPLPYAFNYQIEYIEDLGGGCQAVDPDLSSTITFVEPTDITMSYGPNEFCDDFDDFEFILHNDGSDPYYITFYLYRDLNNNGQFDGYNDEDILGGGSYYSNLVFPYTISTNSLTIGDEVYLYLYSCEIESDGLLTTITEVDAQPNMNCNAVSVDLDETGVAIVPAITYDNGTTDYCNTTLTFSTPKEVFDCGDLGSHNIIVTVTNPNGYTNTCSTTLYVNENSNPLYGCCPLTRDIPIIPSGNEIEYQAQQIITSDANISGSNGTDIIMHAGSYIDLGPGFNVDAGATFEAYTEGCDVLTREAEGEQRE